MEAQPSAFLLDRIRSRPPTLRLQRLAPASLNLALDGLADEFGPVFLLAQKRGNALEGPGRELRSHHIVPALLASHFRVSVLTYPVLDIYQILDTRKRS